MTADEAKKNRRDNGARDSIAHGVAAQPGTTQTRADAELAYADKVLAAAKRTRPGRGPKTSGKRPPPEPRTWGRSSTPPVADANSKPDAAAAKDAAKAAVTRKADTAKAASEAKLALEPVSVYISRATQKLYVRRNTHKQWADGGEVFDATIEVAVTIRNPDKPIGTHVFTAMARNDAGLRWTVVTIDNADDAKDALDRITIPQELLDRIAPTAVPRSSIIVSDEPLSGGDQLSTGYAHETESQTQITAADPERLVRRAARWLGHGDRLGHQGHPDAMGSDPGSTQHVVAGLHRCAQTGYRTGQGDRLCDLRRMRRAMRARRWRPSWAVISARSRISN